MWHDRRWQRNGGEQVVLETCLVIIEPVVGIAVVSLDVADQGQAGGCYGG